MHIKMKHREGKIKKGIFGGEEAATESEPMDVE